MLPDSGLAQCVENLCIVWQLLSYKTLNVELRLKKEIKEKKNKRFEKSEVTEQDTIYYLW